MQKNQEHQSTARASGLIGYYQEERRTTRIVDLMKSKMEFTVKTDNTIKGEKQFGFQITCIPENKEKIHWRIRKAEENIRSLNEKIEEECKVNVPFYYRILASVTDRESHYDDRTQAYRSYIQKLLQNDKYYCPSLFQFIKFDPIRLEVKHLGGKISLHNVLED